MAVGRERKGVSLGALEPPSCALCPFYLLENLLDDYTVFETALNTFQVSTDIPMS